MKLVDWVLSFLATEMFNFRKEDRKEARKTTLKDIWDSGYEIENNSLSRKR